MSGTMEQAGPDGATEREERSALLRDAVDDALAAVNALSDGCRTTASLFRAVDPERADPDLSVVAQNLGSWLVLAQTIASAAVSMEAGTGAHAVAASLEEFAVCLDRLVTARRNSDCIAVADILAYELPEALTRVARQLTTMRPAPGP